MKRAQWCVAATVALVTILAQAAPVSAHAELLSSTPAADSVLQTTPSDIVLTFTEAVDPIDGSIRLVDASGASMSLGTIAQAGGDSTITAAITSTLPDGSYVVAWRAVSADSHPISGAFVFSVGSASPTDPSFVQEVLNASGGDSPSGLWVGIGRFLSFVGIALLLGGTTVLACCAPALLSTGRTRIFLLIAGGVSFVGTAIMIAAQATSIGSSPTDWASVLDTRAGRWWLVRLALLGAGLVGVAFRRRLATSGIARAIGITLAIGLLAVVAAGGHAVTGRAIPLGFTSTVLHLAAMSFWVGGVAVLITVVPRAALWSTATSFSPLALGSVALLAISGAVNGWRQLGTISGLTDTSYGRWLLIKLILVLVVVAVAAVTRWVLRRPVARALALDGPDDPVGEIDSHDPVILRTMVAEMIGIALILGTTAGLVNSTPQWNAAPANASASVVQGDRIAQVDLEPAVTGGTTMHVTITSPSGALDTADEITVTADLPAQEIGPIEIPTDVAGPNHVTTNEADFPLPGVWQITVAVRYGDFDQVVFTTQLQVQRP